MEVQQRQKELFEETKKSMGVANPLFYFLSSFGAHDFYLGDVGRGTLRICLLLIGITCYSVGLTLMIEGDTDGIFLLVLGGILLLILLILNIVDVFILHKRVDEYNRTLLQKIKQGVL